MDNNTVIGYENDNSEIKLGNLQEELLKMLKEVVRIFDKTNTEYFAIEGTLLGAVRHKDIIPWDDDVDLGFMIENMHEVIKVLKENLKDEYIVQCFDTDSNYSVTQPIIKVRKKNTNVDYDAWYDKNHCDCNGIFIDLIAYSHLSNSKLVEIKYRFPAFIRTLFLLGLNFLGLNFKALKRIHINKAIKYNNYNANNSVIGYAINYMCWVKIPLNKLRVFPLSNTLFNDLDLLAPLDKDYYLTKIYGDFMKLPSLDNIKLMHSKNIKLKSKL